MTGTLWHNPRCSKSRQTLALLEDNGHSPEIVRYLDNAPTIAELKSILNMLGMTSARQLMRTGEQVYKDLDLKSITNENSLLKSMRENPKLIERPIVIKDGKAVIGRPPDKVLSLFGSIFSRKFPKI